LSRKQATLAAAILGMILGAAACQSKESEVAASPPAANTGAKTESVAGGAQAGANTVEVDQNMMANVRVEQVREQALHQLLTATGKVQFNEDRTARVLAPLPGQVLDLQVRVGDMVQKGQLLFSIKSREVAAWVTDYLQSQRDQDLAEKTYAMTKDLFDHKAASRISLQQSERDLAKAKAQVARAEEALRVVELDPKEVEKTGGLRSLIPVLAPLSGTVIERTLTSGQFVQGDGTPLLTISDLSTVWVLVDVFESDIHVVRPGLKVAVTAAAYPTQRFMATVDRISDKVDPDTRTLKVRLLVSNPGLLLKPEMFISASLELSAVTSGVTVPATAVFTEDDKSYLFVATGERRFERRLVSATPDGPGRLRVTRGLRTGDQIVGDGVLLLKSRQEQQQQN
jgi:membrane fusion protein, heavy metal efflux system